MNRVLFHGMLLGLAFCIGWCLMAKKKIEPKATSEEKRIPVMISIGVNGPDRQGALNDAEAMARFYEERGYAIKRLHGPDATAANIKKALSEMTGGDVIYFSGPGAQMPDEKKKGDISLDVFDADDHMPHGILSEGLMRELKKDPKASIEELTKRVREEAEKRQFEHKPDDSKF